jgi:hypothetical protein
MTDELIKNALLAITSNSDSKTTEILEILKNKSTEFKNALLKVLNAEINKSFFKEDHFQESVAEKDFFNYNNSKEISKILGIIYPNLNIENIDSNLISKSVSSEMIYDSLNNDGYFQFPDVIENEIIEEIKEGLRHCSFIKNPPTHQLYKIKNEFDLKNIDTNTLWVFDNQRVLEIPAVQKLLLDKNILSAIEKYLGCQPIHVSCTTWWSKFNKLDQTSLNYGAQLYHQDKEFVKFVKVFVYLSDVDDSTGPHEYIAGSHKDYENHTPPNYKVTQRLTDEYLYSTYSKDRFKSFTGNAGTVIITDSNGFHKGKPLLKGYRQLLQFEFASSLYFNCLSSFSNNKLTDNYQKFLNSNPRFALNYNNDKYLLDLKAKKRSRVKYFFETTKRELRSFAKKILKKS